ncbi:hypothetical protein [Kordia jejudonensis]|uniref:hypothetical protein n=1 Tax=Kordia jejudonensis TaxID=1348245 RepID=UPI0012E042B5|nr:hypothetical protein [Kordia jejudonensis]
MKKRGIKNLLLNKKSISTLDTLTSKGGGKSDLCSGLAGSCWCDVTVTDCACPRQ